MIDLILKWFVPFACGGIATGCLTYIKMRRAKDRAVEAGVQCLLRESIVDSHDKYTKQGYCPTHGKEAVERSYDAYKALGGNDVATELYKQILKLPTQKQERSSA